MPLTGLPSYEGTVGQRPADDTGPAQGLAPPAAASSRGNGTATNGSLFGELYMLHVGKEVNAVSLSLDSKRLAIASQDHTVRIWDLESRSQLATLRGHKYWVTNVAFSPDSFRVASASADKTLKIWNLVEGSCEHTLMGHLLSVA